MKKLIHLQAILSVYLLLQSKNHSIVHMWLSLGPEMTWLGLGSLRLWGA